MKRIVPPIKIQGIKTKLIDDIKRLISFDKEKDLWIEPFLGSGSVLFNIQPKKAIVCDTNKHIINFYKSIQDGKITPEKVRSFLEYHGAILSKKGEKYYYEIRNEFNKNEDPLYFLFLNRSCFNGMIRFNRKGEFNVPFCKKKDRFSKAYITKIVNQVTAVKEIIDANDYIFLNCRWNELKYDKYSQSLFIYLDPPYVGRNTTYFGEWSENDANQLADFFDNFNHKVMLSMWYKTAFRENTHLKDKWKGFSLNKIEHFYHVGATEKNRNSVTEAILINY